MTTHRDRHRSGTTGQAPEIVVGVDGSPGTPPAIAYAIGLARQLGAPVRLLHAVPSYGVLPPRSMLAADMIVETGRELLAELVDQARTAAPDVEFRPTLRIGPRGVEIVEAARNAQLVVLGRAERNDLGRVLSGSTAAAVATRTSCPVRVVPAAWTPGSSGAVVVGLKDIEISEELLRRGLALAAQVGGRLVVLHAWHLPAGYEQILTEADAAEWNASERDRVERALTHLRAEFPTIPIEVRIVQARPADALVAASADAALILVGRHSHRRPFRKLGSVARTLQHAGHCPIEVGPPSQEPLPELELVLERQGAMLR